jgi:hypothetical protein
MSEHTAASNSGSNPEPATLQPAEVVYAERVLEVENPFGMEALSHQKVFQVWKLLVVDGQVVQNLGLMSSTIMDDRFLLN